MQNENENDQDIRKAEDGQMGTDIRVRPKVESTDLGS